MKHTNDIELLGIFSKELGEPLYDISQMAIMGIVDAIKKIRWLFKVADEMVELAKDADKILLMDASGFNLPLAKKLKVAYPNKEIIYYILPQIWLTRPKRAKKLEQYCDHLLGILPFEVDFYSSKARYIGHPLLDEIPKCKDRYEDTGFIAYLPGSRKSEIKKLMPIYKEVAKKINKKNLLVIPSHFSSSDIQEIYGDIDDFEISRNTYDTFLKSEFAFVCSGTATLEAALIGVPLVLAYKAKKFDAFIARIFVKLQHVGLANIICDFAKTESLHVELLQEDVTVENLMQEYINMDRKLFFEKSQKLHALLKHGSKDEMIKLIKI